MLPLNSSMLRFQMGLAALAHKIIDAGAANRGVVLVAGLVDPTPDCSHHRVEPVPLRSILKMGIDDIADQLINRD
jgi:hypothetical protein